MNFVSRLAVRIFLRRNVRQTGSGAPKQLLSTECGELSQKIKRPGCKAHQLPLASAVGKNVWNFTSVIPRRVTWSQRLYLYVTNHTVYTDFNIPYVSDVINERLNKYHNKLDVHPNQLLQPLLQPINTRRLKRCWPLDLQGTGCNIAGWTPYHDIVIHGNVAYLYNCRISLQTVLFLMANK